MSISRQEIWHSYSGSCHQGTHEKHWSEYLPKYLTEHVFLERIPANIKKCIFFFFKSDDMLELSSACGYCWPLGYCCLICLRWIISLLKDLWMITFFSSSLAIKYLVSFTFLFFIFIYLYFDWLVCNIYKKLLWLWSKLIQTFSQIYVFCSFDYEKVVFCMLFLCLCGWIDVYTW